MRLMIGWTDALIYLLVISLGCWLWHFKKTDEWGLIRDHLIERPRYIIVLMILIVYATIGFLDSIHFRSKVDNYKVNSVLDILLSPRNSETEITYSAPFATHAYSPEMERNAEGINEETFPRLNYAGQHLTNPKKDKYRDIGLRILFGLGLGLLFTGLMNGLFYFLRSNRKTRKTSKNLSNATNSSYRTAWVTLWITLGAISCLISVIAMLIPEYHILGTDKIGRDVFYIAIKSIRTGLVIGTVTLLITLPFALLFGMWAGYFGRLIGDIIQYICTILSSIPGVLLIAAAMLSFQTMVEANPDLRLVILCIILGVTNWTALCRLLRAETLKLRESDFVQSAITLGTGNLKIIRRHILPNLTHIIIITVALDFSGLVLAEAVLSYVGVGVDSTSFSWGNMINASRLEMSRDPMVWWSLLGAFILMFTLVFSANVFADALQEALNPRMREE
jgi:peptide/nickel transport system permease protein